MARTSASAKEPPKRRSRARAAEPEESLAPLTEIATRGRIRSWLFKAALGVFAAFLLLTLALAFIRPLATPYMISESRRLEAPIQRKWASLEEIAPAMARAVVAAEDANFCNHWGLDLDAIRYAMSNNSGGASTISQQVVKNVFLWHGHSWLRKALEAGMTPLVETIWSKHRILELYLNVAEFDAGVFGVEAAAQHYFGTTAAKLSRRQAALLAAILPDPKNRSASKPSAFVNRRADRILDGAATIAADGRDACFQISRD